jgi:hypothetical protein
MKNLPRTSHILIVQDDVRIARNFAPAVKAIARANPDTPVCLFLAQMPRDAAKRAQKAQLHNTRYIDLPFNSFLPIVAVLWPRTKLVEFAEWAAEARGLPGQANPRSDDAVGGMWKRRTKQRIRVAVPSIVDHPDEEPSTIGKKTQWGGKPRSAVLFSEDATRYDWG